MEELQERCDCCFIGNQSCSNFIFEQVVLLRFRIFVQCFQNMYSIEYFLDMELQDNVILSVQFCTALAYWRRSQSPFVCVRKETTNPMCSLLSLNHSGPYKDSLWSCNWVGHEIMKFVKGFNPFHRQCLVRSMCYTVVMITQLHQLE